MSTNIIKEIKDEAKKDAIAQFFKKNRKILTKTAIATAILLVFYFIYAIFNNHQEEKYSKFLHQSLIQEELGHYQNAKIALEKIINARFAPKGVKALASIRYAGFLLLENKSDQAIKLYEKIAYKSSNDDFLQELAGLLAAKAIINQTTTKNTKIEQSRAISRVTRITQNNKTLKPHAQEQLAILYFNLGKNDEAKQVLAKITKGKNAPQSLLSRVKDMNNL